MSNLMDFELSHNNLTHLIERIKEAGFRSEEAKEILMENKSFILSHILKSNRDYYPILQLEAESIPQLSRIFTIFAADMKVTGKTIQDFYMHFHYREDGLAYAGEYGKIYALLTHCAHKENTILSMLNRFGSNRTSGYQMAAGH